MNKTVELLRDWGCDVDGAIARFVDDEEFYTETLALLPEEPDFINLGTALERGSCEDAFNCAHTLKGVVGNMGITPIYTQVSDLTEMLRDGQMDGTNEKYSTIIKLLEVYKRIVL